MTYTRKNLPLLFMFALIALAALLGGATVLAASGDYGVATGSSSSCGGTGEPACSLNWSGYGLTYSHTESDGDHVYTFDDFDCTFYFHPNGNVDRRGSECNQYQP